MGLYYNEKGESKDFPPGKENDAIREALGFVYTSPPSKSTSNNYGTANWAGVNKLVADIAYTENGVLYFGYEITNLYGEPAYVVYRASLVTPSQYNGNWGSDAAGNARIGPRKGSKPTDALLLDGGEFAVFTLGEGNPAQGKGNLPAERGAYQRILESGYNELSTKYSWFFDKVDDDYPGMELLFSRLGQGLSVSPTDLLNAGVGSNVTQLELDYLNSIVVNPDTENPLTMIVNGEEVINNKFVKHKDNVKNLLDKSLGELYFDATLFEKENKVLYNSLLNVLLKGKVSSALMTDFIGYALGQEGYTNITEEPLKNLFKSVKSEITSEQFSPSSNVLKNSVAAENLAISKIGYANYMNLSNAKKNELILLYNDNQDAAKQKLQSMFDELYPQYAGKNLDFDSIKGKYDTKWLAAFNEKPDETNSTYLDGFNMSASDASKMYMEHAYKTGNEYFMRKLATNIQQSLGGPVIR